MDPFTIALATFGVQKLRGKSTGRSLRDAAMAAGIGYGIGQFAGGAGLGIGQGSAFSSLGYGTAAAGTAEAAAAAQAAGAGEGIAALNAGTGGQFAGASLLEPVSVANPGSFLTNYSAMPTAAEPNWFMKNIVGTSDIKDAAGKVTKEGSGFLGLGTGAKLGIGAAGLTAASSLIPEEEVKPLITEEERAAAKAAADAQISGLTSKRGAMPTYSGSPYDYSSNYYRFNQGGIVDALPKFNMGGINYMPSKQTHDENDVHNYIRAEGYVEDGSGNGDKDEDTILAQLADGEFVSRADSILGAGIMEGASPSSMKDMRKKGAAFFYDQQSKFKRVYDLLNASRKDN
jgi:hypothetical protein